MWWGGPRTERAPCRDSEAHLCACLASMTMTACPVPPAYPRPSGAAHLSCVLDLSSKPQPWMRPRAAGPPAPSPWRPAAPPALGGGRGDAPIENQETLRHSHRQWSRLCSQQLDLRQPGANWVQGLPCERMDANAGEEGTALLHVGGVVRQCPSALPLPLSCPHRCLPHQSCLAGGRLNDAGAAAGRQEAGRQAQQLAQPVHADLCWGARGPGVSNGGSSGLFTISGWRYAHLLWHAMAQVGHARGKAAWLRAGPAHRFQLGAGRGRDPAEANDVERGAQHFGELAGRGGVGAKPGEKAGALPAARGGSVQHQINQ